MWNVPPLERPWGWNFTVFAVGGSGSMLTRYEKLRVERAARAPSVQMASVRVAGSRRTSCASRRVTACSRAARRNPVKPDTSARARTVSRLRPIEGATNAAAMASTMMVTASSMRVKPRFTCSCAPAGRCSLDGPGSHVGVLSGAARLSVGAITPEIVLAVLSGTALIVVRVSPRIAGNGVLLQIGPVPVVAASRVADQPLERSRVGAHVEAVLIEGCAEQLDLRAGGYLLRLADASEELGCDEAGQKTEDDHDDDHLDQREPAAVPEGPRHAGQGHICTSVIEKIAMSNATTMKPTIKPMMRMMVGSSIPMRRLTSRRTSDSRSAASLSSISSRRPVSSPTRTMCTAIGGKAPDSFSGLVMPAPRRTPSATRSMARPRT